MDDFGHIGYMEAVEFQKRNIYKLKCTVRRDGYRNVFRVFKIRGNNTLYRLAREIVNSFGFDLDSSYGFFSNFQDIEDSMESYSSFIDDGEPYESVYRKNRPRINKGTRYVRIKNVFEPGKRMLFYFDYNIGFEFCVECTNLLAENPDEMYPYVCQIKGVGPDRYPY